MKPLRTRRKDGLKAQRKAGMLYVVDINCLVRLAKSFGFRGLVKYDTVVQRIGALNELH